MLSRRNLLKALGLAPAVPAMAALAGKAEASGVLVGGSIPGDYLSLTDFAVYPFNPSPLPYAEVELTEHEVEAILRGNRAEEMARLTGLPVNEQMRDYCNEIVEDEPKRYAACVLPFAHPEF